MINPPTQGGGNVVQTFADVAPCPSSISKIFTTDATVRTLQIVVKAMTIGTKQVTLAVFRQLPRIDPLTEEGGLRPDIECWGHVNYPIKDEGEKWAVISCDGGLHRACIDIVWRNVPNKHWYPTVAAYEEAVRKVGLIQRQNATRRKLQETEQLFIAV